MFNTLQQFGDIPPAEWAKAVVLFKSLHLKKNEYFIRQGDQPSRLAFITSGLFRVFCITETGEEKTLSFRTKGQFIAAYTPYLENRETWYSIEALKEGDLLYITLNQHEELFQSHPCWERLFQNYIVRLFIEKEDRERSFLMEDAKTRYLRFKEKYPEIEQQIHQFHVASFLGISPVSLSRIRSDLKKNRN
jgi:CRP-like cAMP-binding protein